MAPIIGGQGEADITPSSFEVSDPMIKWQRELDSIRARHDRLEISNRQELLAHKDQIAQEVTHRLNESMSAINNEIMEYLLKTQRQIQSWAEDTKSARWEALELRYKEREEERRKHKDQQILDHFKLYESIMQRNADAPQQPSTSKPRPEVAYRGPEPPVPMPPAQAGVRVLPSQGHLFTPSEPQRQLQPLAYHPMVPPQPLPSHGVPIHPAAPVHQDIPFQNESEATIHRNQNKRKADDVTPIREHEVIAKRPRTRDGANSAGASSTPFRAGQPRPESQSQGTTSGGDQRRISFAEVYQDGNAEYKHIIVEYPTKSNKWYILRCDEHVVHFGKNPLLGAAKHLHSVQHNNAAKLHSLAVDQLGHLVHDCTAELADKNNAAVNKAFQDGYVPLNVNRLNKAERATQNQTSPDSTPPFMSASLPRKSADVAKLSFSQPGPSRPHPIAANPRPGELYLGYWAQTKTRFPVMVLPLQGDLSATGLPGTLASIGLMEAAPRCINVDRPTQQVIGWAPGYENGGPLSCKREYPVMYFDGKKHVGWLQAKYISPFNFEAPDASAIPEFDVARDYYARAKGFPDYEHMKRHSGVPPTAPTQVATSPREPLVHTPTSSHFPGLTRSPRAGEPRPAENGSDMRRQWHTKGLPGTGSFRIPDRNSPSLVASHQGFTPSNSPPLKTVNAALSGTSESLVLPPILTTAPHPQGHGSGIHKLLASDVSPVNQASPHSFINSNPASFSDKTGSTPPQQKATPVSRSSPKPSTDDTAPAAAADLMGIANRAISASASTAGSTESASETQSNETGEQAKTLREKAKLSMEKLSTAFPAAEASVAASDSSVSSLTPVPTSASDPPSRKSTPAISPLENSDKWEGRASEGAAATSSRPKSSSSTAQGAASPPAHSPMPTPVSLNDEAMGSKERRFVVAEYSADEQQMADGKEASPLTLVVGGESQVAESHNKDLKVQIDPKKIATITMSQDETVGLGKAVLQLRGVDGSASQQLTFESTASDASPVESGRLQARQFIRWIKSVNSKVTFNDDSASNGVKKESTSG